MSFSEQGLTQQELLKTNKKLVNKIVELKQQKNTLEQYLRIEKEVSDETIKELEQQKAELIEFIKDIVDYEAESVLREREILLNKYKQQEVRDDSR